MSIQRLKPILLTLLFLATTFSHSGCNVKRPDKSSESSKTSKKDPLKEFIDKNGPVKAGSGVGKRQGKGYGDAMPLLKPASVYWKASEELKFNLVTHVKNQFEAVEGRKVKSHEEFMEQIISKSKIQLPKLADGLEYFFDAESGDLMVRATSESP